MEKEEEEKKSQKIIKLTLVSLNIYHLLKKFLRQKIK
jgi:hypothetical protein